MGYQPASARTGVSPGSSPGGITGRSGDAAPRRITAVTGTSENDSIGGRLMVPRMGGAFALCLSLRAMRPVRGKLLVPSLRRKGGVRRALTEHFRT